MVIAHRGEIFTNERKMKISNALKGKIVSFETKQRMSISHTGMGPSFATKQKLSKCKKGNKYWLGKHHTEETKRLIGEKNRLSKLPHPYSLRHDLLEKHGAFYFRGFGPLTKAVSFEVESKENKYTERFNSLMGKSGSISMGGGGNV
jgi:hypothetical protein